MTEELESPTRAGQHREESAIGRRTIVKGAAWTVPVIAAATVSPLAAASTTPDTCAAFASSACVGPEGSAPGYVRSTNVNGATSTTYWYTAGSTLTFTTTITNTGTTTVQASAFEPHLVIGTSVGPWFALAGPVTSPSGHVLGPITQTADGKLVTTVLAGTDLAPGEQIIISWPLTHLPTGGNGAYVFLETYSCGAYLGKGSFNPSTGTNGGYPYDLYSVQN